MQACRDRLEGVTPRFTHDITQALADPDVAAVFVTVPDDLHRAVAVAAFEAGKHVFLEKPLATTLPDARAVVQAWVKSERVLRLGFVLRDTPFYEAVRNTIREGKLGRVHTLRLADDLGVVHGASYMRRWHRDTASSGGLMVHKGCHDLDLVCWLLDTQPARVASFGGAELFARAAPAAFCSQCPEREICPYVDTGAYEARAPEEAADPTAFGLDRCVFGGGKDIVDNQIVLFETSVGVRGVFSLAMQNPGGSERSISVLGERGRLDGVFERGVFEVRTNDGAPATTWRARNPRRGGHGGGDERALRGFLEACLSGRGRELIDVKDVLRGLVFSFAAEEARLKDTLVAITDDLAILTGDPAQAHQTS